MTSIEFPTFCRKAKNCLEHLKHFWQASNITLYDLLQKLYPTSPSVRYSHSKYHTFSKTVHTIIMEWLEEDYNNHLVPTLLPMAGTPLNRPGYSESHPAWSWAPPGSWSLQFLGYKHIENMEFSNVFRIINIYIYMYMKKPAKIQQAQKG